MRLVILDLDGVIVKIKSSWEYMHSYFGSSQNEVYNMYSRLYSSGRVSYLEWMKADIEHLLRSVRRPIYRRDLDDAFSRVEFYEHSFEIMDLVRRRGAGAAIVSGGVNLMAWRAARELGIRHVLSNILVFDEDERLQPGGIPQVEPLKKGYVVRRLLRSLGIEPGRAMFIGDSHWDYPAFYEVGSPVLFKDSGGDDLGQLDPRVYIARDPGDLVKAVSKFLSQ
ncbi:MAG TPA: HAD-IB family phosphatase [Sulfolobales archaeon]|nr:HAD-IB family phosphatase [Sulfolobales archaeon]